MDKLKYIKLENEDGSYSSSIPLAVDADHVDVNGETLTNELNKKANTISMNNLFNEINIQKVRIDSLATLEDGSTTGDAELIDARVGADGITYSTLGDAIRDQIGDILPIEYKAGSYTYSNNQISYSTTGTSVPFKCAKVDISNYDKLIVNTYSNYTRPILLVDKDMGYIASFSISSGAITTLETVTCDMSTYSNRKYLLVNCNKDSQYAITIKGINIGKELEKRDTNLAQTKEELITENHNYTNKQLNSFDTGSLDTIKEKGHVPFTNFIDKNKESLGYLDGTDGKIKISGDWHNTGRVYYLEENVDYYHASLYTGYFAFFDENDNIIEGYGQSSVALTNPFRIPQGTKYAIFSMASANNLRDSYIYTDNIKPQDFAYELDCYAKHYDDISLMNPVDYAGKEIEVFRKCLCIGDSFTQGGFNSDAGVGSIPFNDYSYPTKLKMISGIDTTNKGYGGITTPGWWNAHQNDDLSGHDFCIILLGINDCSYYGGITEESLTALDNIINKVKQENNHIKIFVSTIPLSPYYQTEAIRSSGPIIKNHIESLNDADVYCLDMMTYSHLGSSTAYEYGHPSALGYTLIAQEYYNYISWIINQNKADFRFVQFIGTDRTHNNLT